MLDNYIYNHKGFYQVGNKTFSNKLEGYLELNKIGGNHDIHWDYHDDVFGKCLWEHEPPVDILEIYKNRAIQLREQYDHLVLFYSSGADSHTILQTFIKNNIKIDEVFVYGAFEAENKVVNKLGYDRTPGYYTREVTQVGMPVLKELQKTHKFKLTVWDWTNHTLDALKNPDWFWDVGVRYAPDAIPRNHLHEVFRHNDRFEGKGKSVAFIFGVDKPRLYRDDHSVYFAFTDTMLTTAVGNNADINNRYWENDEYFYWTPNMPELVVKQAHLVYNHLKKHDMIKTQLSHLNGIGSFHRAEYYDVVNPIIYPEWNTNTWQVKKSTSSVKDEFGQWFFDMAPEEAYKSWKEGINEMERLIGTRWFNGGSVNNGFIGCNSKFYRIGSVE